MVTTPEYIPRPQVGQVWRPRRGGMWRTIRGVYSAGVEWTASPNAYAFTRFEDWDKWVRDTDAYVGGPQ